MTESYLFTSAVLGTVGAIYTIFIAIAIFAAQYFDKDLKDMKRLLKQVFMLSCIVFITLIYNAYLLYLQSGGDAITRLHFLSELIPGIKPLEWSFLLFFLSLVYIFLFSYYLLFSVYLNVCLIKLDEIKTQIKEYMKKEDELNKLDDKIYNDILESEKHLNELKTRNDGLIKNYKEKRIEILKKLNVIFDKIKTIESKDTITEIKEMFLLEENPSDLSNPFGELLEKTKNVEYIPELPLEAVKEIMNFRAVIKELDMEVKDIMSLYTQEKLSFTAL